MSDQEAVTTTPFHDKLDNLVIDGSSSSHSYLAFAKVGPSILAIKFGSPMDAKLFGVKGCTYIGGRVRSQKITTKIKEYLDEDKQDNVATFQKPFSDWREPWPMVKFEKSDETRASTQDGAFIRGNLKVDPEAILDQFENGAVANKFADFLVKTCGGADNLLMTRDDLVGFIHEVYGPPAKAMRAAIQAEKQVIEQSSTAESIGVFGFQAALMQELYEEKMTDHVPSPAPLHEEKGEAEDEHVSPEELGDDEEPQDDEYKC